jgi:predicted glycosyltransferase
MPAIPVHYIGPLSRLELPPKPPLKQYELMMLLSGPEPQRTLLERKLLAQAAATEGTHLLVRGLPAARHTQVAVPANVVAVPHLTPAMLAEMMLASNYILSRGGYSTLMDMAKLGCRSILVPTPGQTEQQYLARRWQAQGQAVVFSQRGLRLPGALAAAQQHTYLPLQLAAAPPLQPWLQAWVQTMVKAPH